MLISREYAKTVLSTLAQKLSGVYKKPNTGIPESDLADDVREKLGGGLPDASELENGTALVSVDGEWKQTNGYGYEENPITWDGDMEGRARIDLGGSLFVKVSDQVLTLDQIIGATVHFNNNLEPDKTILEYMITSLDGALLFSPYGFTAEVGTYAHITVPESGTYFIYTRDEDDEGEEVELYVSSLTASSVIHPIDKKYIPASAKLPDASSLPDGTALVSVNGEWKRTNGYGYEEPAFDPITWDGDTEGRARIDDLEVPYVKVSDQVLTLDQIIGATVHFNGNLASDITITESTIDSHSGLLVESYVLTAEAGTYDVAGFSITVPESGTYFAYQHDEWADLYPSSLTAFSIIHPIDKTLIPDCLPDYTDADEGKVLKIVDGVPTWVTP